MEPPADSEPDAGEPSEPPGRPSRLAALALLITLLVRAALAPAGETPPPEPPTPSKLEKQMLALVNRDRAERQKKPLEHDDRLAAVARSHSEDMAENGFFGHESPTTGRVRDRLNAAKIKVVVAGENVARNATIERAQAALMKSPGHRKNILRDIYTHCGIGVARDARARLLVTQVFAVPAPDVDLKTARKTLLRALARERIQAGRLPFQPNPTLDRLATQAARRMAEAGTPIRMNLSPAATAAGLKHRHLTMLQMRTWTPEDLARTKAVLKPKVGRVGIGLAENIKHQDLGLGIIWAVVLFTDD
jgi:uncharacterized protein YkwD